MKKNIFAIVFITLLLTKVNAQSKEYSHYKTIHVGDESGWDYLAADEANRNIYFSHATKVLVASMDNDSIVAEIPNTFGVHGIAFDNELNRGFISNGKANSVTVFDLSSFTVIDTVAVSGVNPDAILYDPFSKNVFAFNGKTNNATVIDPASLKVTGTIPLPGKPEFAVTDLKGKIYVNIEDKNELVQLDAVKLSMIDQWTVLPGNEPTGLAIDRKNNLLFSVCGNKQLIIFSIKKGEVIDSLPIGGRVDAVVFDPQSKLIYTSNGEGNVTIVKQRSPVDYEIIQTLVTQRGCKTMALDSKTKKIYLPAAKFEGETRKILPGSFDILIYK
jgi:DNA-binding beta-propeller fold protein YncE